MSAIIGSVRVAGFISPTDSTDTYAVTDEIYHRGGYRTVATVVDRDLITTDRRKIGMLVYVTTTDQYYQLLLGLTNSNWVSWAPTVSASSGRKFSQVIGNGVDTTYVITHNLNTLEVISQVYEVTSGEQVLVNISVTSTNTVSVSFAYPPITNSYRVVVV